MTLHVDGGHVGEDVAAAGRDGDQVLAVLELQRLEIDDRIFPDLRIDEAREGEREQPLLDARAG